MVSISSEGSKQKTGRLARQDIENMGMDSACKQEVQL